MTVLRRSPLHDRHVALGAKFAEFGGWSMPLQYTGVLAEHRAVRSSVGVFDVSHLGKARVAGPGAVAFLNGILTNDLDRIGAGQAQYTLLCAPDGGVLDDIIAYRLSDDEVLLIPNAANNATVVAALRAEAPSGLAVTNEHEAIAVIAVQGRASRETLAAIGLPTGHGYMDFGAVTWRGVPLTVCRTGYTGERGYELLVPSQAAGTVWDAILAAGSGLGIVPAGLGARDTLRTEMGYPLHGQDLSQEITPLQAGLGWAVGWSKPSFHGSEALRAERAGGPRRRSRGLLATGRGIPRPGMAVIDSTGAEVGRVTSGTFSPTCGRGIALALLAPSVEIDDRVRVAVRDRLEEFAVVKPPFVTPGVRQA